MVAPVIPFDPGTFIDVASDADLDLEGLLGKEYALLDGRVFRAVRMNEAAGAAAGALMFKYTDRSSATDPWDVEPTEAANDAVAGVGPVDLGFLGGTGVNAPQTVPDNAIFLLQIDGVVTLTQDSGAAGGAIGALFGCSGAEDGKAVVDAAPTYVDVESVVFAAEELVAAVADTIFEARCLRRLG